MKKCAPGELTQKQWNETEEGKAEGQRILRAVEQARRLRAQLGDGDDSEFRMLLELREVTGLDVGTLEELGRADVYEWVKAAIRKRSGHNDQWIKVKAIDAISRQKLWRHATDGKHDYVRNSNVEGIYEIKESHLIEYFTPSVVRQYLGK